MTRTVALQPVWDGYCADPFVLRTADGYVMYGSAPALFAEGRAFQTLFSPDRKTWTDVGGALEPAADAPPGTEYWAPEVVAANGLYWMYYSSGVGDVGHQLRVAKATDPLGPFWDVGVVLTPDLPFAIDPSPFRDSNGSWWLFFATDFLDSERPGTVLAVAAMDDMTSLGEPQIVLTAFADWQRYEAGRQIYRQVRDWHTLEGPTVVCRDGRYWMTYSGGNWHNAGYGVGLATAEHPGGPWAPYGKGAAFLNSDDSGLTGPGHNSLFSVDGDDFAVFHAWDPTGARRRPYVEPVIWGVTGPALTP
ncbi:glycoside hydrolase family 43 protein [Acidothermaceae bacterium B102]|nr:glycoside hydrolase family 43 protein [Acidothermaceae bacterium B102]